LKILTPKLEKNSFHEIPGPRILTPSANIDEKYDKKDIQNFFMPDFCSTFPKISKTPHIR